MADAKKDEILEDILDSVEEAEAEENAIAAGLCVEQTSDQQDPVVASPACPELPVERLIADAGFTGDGQPWNLLAISSRLASCQ